VWAKGEGEREKEGFDISLSVDRKLKLPLGSNEISNYPWNTVSPGLIAHTHTHTHIHTHSGLIIHMCTRARVCVYVYTGNLGGRKRDARSDS